MDFNRLPRATRERFINSLGPKPEWPPLLVERESLSIVWWTLSGFIRLPLLLEGKLRQTFFRSDSKAFLADDERTARETDEDSEDGGELREPLRPRVRAQADLLVR